MAADGLVRLGARVISDHNNDLVLRFNLLCHVCRILQRFSAAVISVSESSRGGSAPTSVTSDEEHKSSGYASLIAEINALDFSDDVISGVSSTIGENLALCLIVFSCVTSTLDLIKALTLTHPRTSVDLVAQNIYFLSFWMTTLDWCKVLFLEV